MLLADPNKYVLKGARISKCGRYRYSLWREWRGTHDPEHWRWYGTKDGAGHEWGDPKSVLFVMLNPSTADGEADDPTIRKCAGFARRWRYERLEIVNLFAYRATKPRELFAADARREDIIGWENSSLVARAAREAGIIVCAWGAHAAGHDFHIETVRGWLISSAPQYHLGLTAHGYPRHPLYVPYDQELVPMPE